MDPLDEIPSLLPGLRRYARALTGCPAAADDLVQDAVERALRHTDKFEPGTDLGAWVARIVHNLHVNRRLQDRPRPRATPGCGRGARGGRHA